MLSGGPEKITLFYTIRQVGEVLSVSCPAAGINVHFQPPLPDPQVALLVCENVVRSELLFHSSYLLHLRGSQLPAYARGEPWELVVLSLGVDRWRGEVARVGRLPELGEATAQEQLEEVEETYSDGPRQGLPAYLLRFDREQGLLGGGDLGS